MANWKRLGLTAFTFVSLTAMNAAHADLVFSGAGSNNETGNQVSGAATFKVSGNILTLTLTNTTLGGTTLRGDVLQGIAFNVNGVNPTLTLTTIALTSPGSSSTDDRIFTTKTAANTSDPLSGSYTTVLGVSPVAEFGVSSTGFAGGFNAGSITRGTGGADYGIVAAGTFPPGSGSSNSFNAAFPLIQDSLSFTFQVTGNLAESQFEGVKFLFGTDGTGIINASTPAVPEPSSLVLLGSAGAILLAGRTARGRYLSKCNA
ncbi:PEP-CTERM sorting domain-containing protein [Isosphaeraceae bacterium EP7]